MQGHDKIETILSEAKESVDTIHESENKLELKGKYTKEDARKDLFIVYSKTSLKLVKLYGPAIAIGAASIAALIGSHNIAKKRYISLASAYATLDTSFKKYRARLAERFGDDIEKEIRYGLKAEEVSNTVTDEKGKEKTVTETIKIADCPYDCSPDAKWFDESSVYWVKDADQNLMFLNQREQYANDLLCSRGFLVLNDIYDMLGIPKTKRGMTIGWVYDKEVTHKISFGVYNCHRKNREFVNGYERVILLDFNPDGDIYNLDIDKLAIETMY